MRQRAVRDLLRHIAATAVWLSCATWVAAQDGSVRSMDFRIVLAQLAQKVGANGQIAILQAQGPSPAPALVVQGGVVDMAQLAGAAGDAVRIGKDGQYIITRPVLVWADATLSIAAGDHLHLDAASGAFLATLGGLQVNGGTIASDTRVAQTDEDTFHPFVLVAGQGHITANKATFRDLGFGSLPAFSGLSLINRGIFPPLSNSTLLDNRFERIGGVSLLSVEDAILQGNVVAQARGSGITVRAGDGISLKDNAIEAPVAHGLRISEGSRAVSVTGTTINAPGRTGILVDSRSAGVDLTGNAVVKPASTGVLIDSAFCVRGRGNRISGGKSNGIVVQRSAKVALSGNELRHNRSAGIAMTAQPRAADVLLQGNQLIGNRVGIKGSTSGFVRFAANDFSDQFPRFLEGDLTHETGRVARDLRGAEAFDFAGAHDARDVILPDCTIPGGA